MFHLAQRLELLEFGPQPSDLIPLTYFEPLEALRSSGYPVRGPHLPADAPRGGFGKQGLLALPCQV
jgi:hypothetical protein